MHYETILNECEAALVSSESNLYYITRFHNADASAVFTKNERFYFTDKRYLEDAHANLKGWEVVDVDSLSAVSKAAAYLMQKNVKTLGIEEENLSAKQYLYLKNALKSTEFFGINDKLSELRAVKTPEEFEVMRQAQSITDTAFRKVLNRIREGITEKELAAQLEFILKNEGADALAFPSIVAFGENTSKPHAVPSDRALKKRDFITLDFGAKFGGYCSDMTRTVAFHAMTQEMSDCYYLVLEAQLKAISAAKSGMKAKDLDAVARNFFKDNYVEERFLHSLGHSLGIDIHESVRISKNSENILSENMVYSVEPGLYFEGKFGVRIEDVVIQRKSDVENLTLSEKQLIIVQ